MKVVVYPLAEPGHINPTLPVARRLVARGHEVIYLTAHDLCGMVRAAGFPCIPIHEAALHQGRLTYVNGLEPDEYAREIRRVYLQLGWDFTSGRIEEQLDAIRPDLVLADVFRQQMTLTAHRLGIPCRQVNVCFADDDVALPPVTSPLRPDAPALVRQMYRWGQSPARLVWRLEAPAMRFGYPVDRVSAECAAALGTLPALLDYPELVLAPEALDLPRRSGPSDHVRFVTMRVDLGRQESVPPELAAFVDGKRQLIYASLGTQGNRYTHAPAFVDAVRTVIAAHPEWQGVLVVGERLARDASHMEIPPNLLVLPRGPQLWLLRRSAVFVTHAGIGGLREAIALRVPMVAVPQGYDQPGNAVRIEHHELGLRIRSNLVDAPALSARIEKILSNREHYVSRLEAMARRCESDELERKGVELLEEAATGRRTVSPRPMRRTEGPSPRTNDAFGWMFIDKEGWYSGAGGRIRFRADAEVVTQNPPSLGDSPTVCRSIADALALSSGPVLARVRVSEATAVHGDYVVGRRITCLWTRDVSGLLYEMVRLWTARSLALAFPTEPELVTFCVREIDALWGDGAPSQPRVNEWMRLHDGTWEKLIIGPAMVPLFPNALAACQMLAHMTARDASPEAYEGIWRQTLDAALLALLQRIVGLVRPEIALDPELARVASAA